MEYPLVSVVIPVYNMEPFLGETLDSVLASDYPSLEVVVLMMVLLMLHMHLQGNMQRKMEECTSIHS